MSNNPDDFEEEEDEASGGNDAGGPKALRAALKAANKKAADLETENISLKKLQKNQTVSDVLKAAGARPSLAKFYDRPEASEDEVLSWLKENAEDFGWSPDNSDSEEDEETVDEAQRIGRVTAGEKQKSLSPRVDPEFIRTAPREKLIELGLIRA